MLTQHPSDSTSGLRLLPGLEVFPQSIVIVEEVEFGYVMRGQEPAVVVLAPPGAPVLTAFEGTTSSALYGGRSLLIGPTNAWNIAALRGILPWLRPQTLGLRTSAGMGDRLGLATPGHVRALRSVGGSASQIAPVFPQQSMREMARTARTPQQVMDDATWGVFAEGWRDGFGADADHLKTPADIDACIPAGFTFFTVDPGEYVDNRAETMSPADLRAAFEALPWDSLNDTPDALLRRFLDKSIDFEGHTVTFSEHVLLKAVVKYGRVVAHVLTMYRHLMYVANGNNQNVEMEISVDETEQPTSHVEHAYIASELKRLGVHWVSLAPRYIGRFEKGVDYIGDLAAFEADFAVHAAIARHYGPYKLSLHSGSDKFSVYLLAMAQTRGLVHLKTAGTSYLEALRTLARNDPAFFREIYRFALLHYDADRATYHVSASLDRAPAESSLSDADLPGLLEKFDTREILHVTFGSVLTERDADGKFVFYDRLFAFLHAYREDYADDLEAHFRRHLLPFAASQA